MTAFALYTLVVYVVLLGWALYEAYRGVKDDAGRDGD